jgi:hypothetical protein
MSNLKIQGNASGTGTTTLQSGNTNSNLTLALPIADGTANQALVTDGAGVLSFATTGTGTVTAVSVTSTNGFAGTSSGGATPALTLSTSITGVLKGDGTAISAATAGTDYIAPPSGTALLKANSGGALANASAGTDYVAPGAATTFTASQRGTVTTDNDGSFDMNVTNNFSCTPTGTITLTFTNITAGQSGFILLVNGSNYTVAAAATTKVATGVLTALSATGTYLLSYLSDGTNVYLTASGALA